MRSWILLLVVVLSSLVLTLGKVENGLPDREELDTKYLLTNQIVELRAHVEDLEAAAKTHASSLKRKDKKIRSLEKEILQLKDVGISDLKAKLAAAAQKNSGLDLEVSNLKEELERAKVENSFSLKRAEIAEAKADSFQLEASEKARLVDVVNEYKTKVRQLERALQIAQSGMLKAQKEAAAKSREMAQSADAWLPPWLATQSAKLYSLVTSRWATHGEPLVKHLHRAASVKAAQAGKFSKPYVRSFNKKVRPVVRSQWRKVKANVVPQYQRIKKLTVQYYKDGKKYLLPHLSKVHESVDPYVQTVRERSQPFVEQAASFLSPHLEKANSVAGPYVKIANEHYQSVVSQASTYHEQLQDSVKGTMGKHEVLARWATKELIWFLASALLALPVVASVLVFSSVFGSKKPIKPQRRIPSSSHSNTASGIKKPRRPRSADVKQQAK